jgi:hypothetical protein
MASKIKKDFLPKQADPLLKEDPSMGQVKDPIDNGHLAVDDPKPEFVHTEMNEGSKEISLGPVTIIDNSFPIQNISTKLDESSAQVKRALYPVAYRYKNLNNSLEYHDLLLDEIKKVIDTSDECLRRSIRWIQPQSANTLIFYQGNTANVWGLVEGIIDPDLDMVVKHNIKIYNSLLKSVLRKNDLIKSYLEFVP